MARAQTAAVIDPQGDAFYSEGHEAPAFLDILAASITISDTLTLTVDVAGSLAGLPNPAGISWCIRLALRAQHRRFDRPSGVAAASRANGAGGVLRGRALGWNGVPRITQCWLRSRSRSVWQKSFLRDRKTNPPADFSPAGRKLV